MNCFRHFGFKSLEEFNRLTLPEYELLMKAARLREVDRDYRNHLQAYLNFAVKAMKKAGKNKQKPVYSSFKRFYDYEAELDKITIRVKKPDRFAGLKAHLKEGGEKHG